MTNNQLTRERLEKIKSWREIYGAGSNVMLPAEEAEELARMILAAMDSKPVAYISKSDFDAGYPHILARRDFNKACTMPVYAAQPAPVVLKDHQIRELVNQLRDIAIEYHGTQQLRERIARVLRAAMLQAEPVTKANKLGNSPVIPDRWIPVSERLPEDEQEVLTINKMGHRFVSFFDKHSGLFFDRLDAPAACCIERVLVTHWMPLPAAPQEVQGE